MRGADGYYMGVGDDAVARRKPFDAVDEASVGAQAAALEKRILSAAGG
jgi:hypothetical protein